MLSAPVDLGPVGVQARGNESGRLQASSKIENSVVTTGSNNWYREPIVKKKLNPIKKILSVIYGGGTPMCDYGGEPDKKSQASHMAEAPQCVTKGDCWGLVPHRVVMAGAQVENRPLILGQNGL